MGTNLIYLLTVLLDILGNVFVRKGIIRFRKRKACHPFSLHSKMRSWYFRLFLLQASSQPFLMGHSRMNFFALSDQLTMSGLKVVWTIGRKVSLLPRSAVNSCPHYLWRMWFWLSFHKMFTPLPWRTTVVVLMAFVVLWSFPGLLTLITLSTTCISPETGLFDTQPECGGSVLFFSHT